MGLIQLIVVIALVGLLVWGITTLIPMPPKFQQVIYVIALIGVAIYVLSAFGILPHLGGDIRIGR